MKVKELLSHEYKNIYTYYNYSSSNSSSLYIQDFLYFFNVMNLPFQEGIIGGYKTDLIFTFIMLYDAGASRLIPWGVRH